MSPQEQHSLLREIERQTSRLVGIEADECTDTLSKCHPQDQSPIFANLPREIRQFIWEYATAPFEDERHPYVKNEYYYRPGHTARLVSDTSLLLTCRRIWLEANALPMLQAEHCFWYYRAAPDARSPEWMAGLTNLNRANFGHLHLFAQMFAIERLTVDVGRLRNYFLRSSPRKGDFQPRVLHVTIRHTDWWNWEHEAPLRFEDSWLYALLNSPDLRSTQILKLELETLDYKVDQLMPIVNRLESIESKELQTHLVDGLGVNTKFVRDAGREVHKWSGPVDINGQKFSPYKDKGCLNYYVVTLTWRLKFPETPNAHIPAMRLALRLPHSLPRETDVRSDKAFQDEDDSFAFDDKARRSAFYPHYTGKVTRRFGRKKLKTVCLPEHSRYLEMLDGELHVRTCSMSQDYKHEKSRRKLFNEKLATLHAIEWTERWRRKMSLLRFEEL